MPLEKEPDVLEGPSTSVSPRHAQRAVLALLLSLATACGSTVQPGPGSGAPDALGGALQAPGSGDGLQPPSLGAGSATAAGGASVGGGAAGRPADASADGASGALAPGEGAAPSERVDGTAQGRGLTSDTINIGVGTADEDGTSKVIGGLGISVGDSTIRWEAVVKAIVDDINRRGGVVGRKINVVWHKLDAGEAIFSPASAAQKACSTWTEDNKVFAVSAPGLAYMDNLVECLHKHQTPLIHPGGIQGDDRSYQDYYDRYPLYYAPGSMEAGRFDRIAMRRLVERKFFQPWDTSTGSPATGPAQSPVRVGIVVKDDARGSQTLKSLSGELAKYGITFSSVFRNSGDVAKASSEAQAAMLRFRSEGITHLFGTGVFHHQTAEQQGYRPRYFFEHDALNTIALTSPAQQLKGSMAESIVPAVATNEESYPGHPQAYVPCLAVLKAANINPKTNLDHWSAQLACDAFYPLRDALAATGAVSNAGLDEGFARLGERPTTAVTWTSQFTRRQRASAIAVRDASFRAECTCYGYDSSTNHLAS